MKTLNNRKGKKMDALEFLSEIQRRLEMEKEVLEPALNAMTMNEKEKTEYYSNWKNFAIDDELPINHSEDETECQFQDHQFRQAKGFE